MIECLCPSPIGPLRLISNGDALVGLYFEGHRRPSPEPGEEGRDEVLEAAMRQLEAYFRGERRPFSVPISLNGTPFQGEVWQVLRGIPYGETMSYLEIATQLGNPNGSRAVGGAVGANPISIVVPCHRVVGNGGSLTGFAGGEERKRFLLDLEHALDQAALFSLHLREL